ncbi:MULTISPECIES: DeoR/GlpR family DNA-binding transcription regulator [Aerococcus]|nr:MULTISPECIES: DeoR/GlpR family DNA-binding transcription regulator [Aerococcus]KAA9295731.1 DeoR/GlpR transcriptional regulator [Aerococcus tenax]MDK8132725.1 DeoR/GlpR family DNA-binding transcription regulator [Aerococcus urinae]MDL5179363.1 DeoR/GlpR family DNA-binding transcription regulator [Aerococcus tenax]RAV92450.1 DeoR/GlpR transcriptional regulator [Aerococcus tenax]WIW72900.1 DeoR/GlpR family DNA-binding transcription regulator [Aerococcus tenax]
MKNSIENINKRHKKIEEILKNSSNHSIQVNDLAIECNVSAMTIRRDLTKLEKMGIVKRYHGYVSLNTNYQFSEENSTNSNIEKIKISIGDMASKFVKKGDTVFINTSSTALYSLDSLSDKTITIVTNNLRIHEQIHKEAINHGSSAILTGGELRLPKEALTGQIAEEAVSKVIANIAIMGCSGFSIKNGITTSNANESKINRLMIEKTNGLVILVADYRKINNDSNFFVCESNKIDILITDEFCDNKTIREIEDAGIQVIVVTVDPNISKKEIDYHIG